MANGLILLRAEPRVITGHWMASCLAIQSRWPMQGHWEPPGTMFSKPAEEGQESEWRASPNSSPEDQHHQSSVLSIELVSPEAFSGPTPNVTFLEVPSFSFNSILKSWTFCLLTVHPPWVPELMGFANPCFARLSCRGRSWPLPGRSPCLTPYVKVVSTGPGPQHQCHS